MKPNKSRNQEVNSYYRRYLNFSIQFRIKFENESVQLNQFLLISIRILQCFQLVGMILLIYASESQDLSVLNLLLYLSKIARPYLFIKQVNLFYQFSFLFILLPLLVGELALHYLYFQSHSKGVPHIQMLSFMWKQNSLVVCLIHLAIYIRILFRNFLIIPIIDLLAQSYQNNISIGAVSILNLLLVSITSIWIIIILYMEFQINLEYISIDCNNFGTLRKSITDIIELIIEFLMASLNVILQDTKDSIYYLAILMLILGISNNIAVFTNYANIYQNQIIQLSLSNLQIIIGIIFFSLRLFQTKITSLQIILLITLYFPLNNIVTKYFEIHYHHILLPQSSKISIQIFHYKIANIYQIAKIIPNTYQLVLINILRKMHFEECDSITCKCKTTTDSNASINIFMARELIHFKQLITELRNLDERFIYFLHYISLMNDLGYNNQVYEQTNMLDQENSDGRQEYKSIVSMHSLRQNSQNNNNNRSNIQRINQIKLGNLNIFDRSKLQIIRDNIKNQLGAAFIKQNQSLSESLEHAVKLFLQSENKNQTIKAKILQMIETKKNFLLQIMKLENIQTLFNKSKTLAISLQDLEIELQQQHAKFPSQKLKALNCFFQAEIMNNYFQAFKIQNLSSISDDKLLKMHAQSSFDLFSSRIDYLNIGFDEKENRLQILYRSNLAHELFEYKKDKFSLIEYIGSILPNGFEHIHDEIVQGFLETGKSKYFRKINMNFIRTVEAYIKPINFFYDINTEKLDEMTFVAFFQDTDQSNAFILISGSNRITNISKNLCNKFGISSKHLLVIQTAMVKSKIQKWIPSFNQCTQNQTANTEKIQSNQVQVSIQLYSLEFRLINPDILTDDSSYEQTSYEVDLMLHIREIQDYTQTIIEIQNARQIKSLDPTDIYEDNLNDQVNEDICSEQEVIPPYYLEDIKSNSTLNKLQNKTDQQFMAPILESYRTQHGKQELIEQKSEIYEDESIKEQENINKINQLQFDDIDQEMQDNIRMQMQMDKQDAKVMHIDDIGSQVSSIAGIKTSRFYKKYQFIEKVLTSQKFSIKYDLMNAFIILLLVTFQIQCILYFYNAQADLSRFLEEISMIQIRTNIIGPMNKYIMCQNILGYYNAFITYGIFTQAVSVQKARFTKVQYVQIYDSLKDSLQQQLQNPYFLPFIINQNLTVQQAYYPKVISRTLPLNEVLYILQEANHKLSLINYDDIFSLDLTSAFMVYQYINYEVLNEYCKSLNSKILNYSVQRSDTVKTKWYFILIPCLILSSILLMIAYQYFQQYMSQYVKILSFYQLTDVVWLLRDVERYKAIISLLSADDDVMFKYTFDIDLKEKFMMAEDFRKEKLAQKSKIQKNKQKLELGNAKMPIINNVLVFALIYAIYFVFCFVPNDLAQVYFGKYPDTTKFFNILSDLEVAVTGAFSMRQASYQIKRKQPTTYYFFPNPSTDANYFVKEFQLDIDVISNFLQTSSTFDQSLYITSDSFASQFSLLQSNDTCNFLPADLITLAQSHCDAVYEGVLRRGLQTALTKFRDALQNEFITSYQFSNQVFSIEEQMEGGLIAAIVVSILRAEFQRFLVDQTNVLILDINVINALGTIFNVFGLICLLTLIRNYYIREFSIVKRFLLLLPQSSLFLDVQIERQLRQIIVQDNLL